MVRHRQHPFLHHQGLCAALRRDPRQDGALGRARRLRPAGAAEPAMVGLEYVRRAGRVPAKPGVGKQLRLVGWAKAHRAVPTVRYINRERWARFALPTLRLSLLAMTVNAPSSTADRAGPSDRLPPAR